jgi:Ferritin-like
MPADPKEPDIEEIKREAMEGNEGRAVNRVGALYARIIKLFEDSTALPDREFREDSVGYQADFATWGRNYTRGQRPDIQTDQLKRSPELIIRPIGSRTQALAALRAVAEQGEGASIYGIKSTTRTANGLVGMASTTLPWTPIQAAFLP